MKYLMLLSLLLAPLAHADEVYTFVIKKQEEKKKTRWSLQDWLDTKNTMMMQDLWLAMHAPSPYEFFIAGSLIPGNERPGRGSYLGGDLRVGGFASIFGVELQYDRSFSDRWIGLVHLRLLGYHEQATNITLQGGYRSQSDGGTFKGALAGVRMTLYLTKFFGVEGLYRHYFETTDSESGARLTGSRYGAGAFIDFSFVRLFAFYFVEPTTVVTAGGNTDIEIDGVHVGWKLFL